MDDELSRADLDDLVTGYLIRDVDAATGGSLFFGSNGDPGAYTELGKILHEVIVGAIRYGRVTANENHA